MRIEKNKSTLSFITKFSEEYLSNKKVNEVYSLLSNRVFDRDCKDILEQLGKQLGKNLLPQIHSDKKIRNNSYYKNISLDNVVEGDIMLKNELLPAKTCLFMNYPEIKNVYGGMNLRIGYYINDISIPVLKENDTLWMSITEMEIYTSEKELKKAKGDILVVGL